MLLLSKCTNSMPLHVIKRCFMTRFCGLMYPKINQVNNIDTTKEKPFIPIYKTSHLLLHIGLNRIKTFQTVTSFGLIPVFLGLNILGYFTIEDVICGSLLGLGFTAGLHVASWLISNNLVVFVYLSEDEQNCQMSYISYWGKRSEIFCDIKDIEPIKCTKLDVLNYKIKLNGNDKTFKIILQGADIYNSAKFRKVFGDEII